MLALLVATVVRQEGKRAKQASSRWILAAATAGGILLVGWSVRLVEPIARWPSLSSASLPTMSMARRRPIAARCGCNFPAQVADLAYSRAMRDLAARTPNFAVRLAASQQALESGIRAVSNAEDRQNAWYNLATVLAIQNDSSGVERALRNAMAWAPNWFKPHWALAQYLELANRHKEALGRSPIAVECDGNKDPEVVENWKKLAAQP